MISAETTAELDERRIPYILGARMRRVKDISIDVLSRAGRFSEVYPEEVPKKDPSPLKVKQVYHNGQRYIVCLNTRQARKDAQDREAIITSLNEQNYHQRSCVLQLPGIDPQKRTRSAFESHRLCL